MTWAFDNILNTFFSSSPNRSYYFEFQNRTRLASHKTWNNIIEKLLQKDEVTYFDYTLAVVDVVVLPWEKEKRTCKACEMTVSHSKCADDLVAVVRESSATTTPQINDLIGWMRKNNHAARAARFLVHCFDVVCQAMTWNFHIWGPDENSSAAQFNFHSLPSHESQSCQASESALRSFCTTWPTWNNRKTPTESNAKF